MGFLLKNFEKPIDICVPMGYIRERDFEDDYEDDEE